jgi:hypothetical protein
MKELEELLEFEREGAWPIQYRAEHNGEEYFIRYRWGCLLIIKGEDDTTIFEQQLAEAEALDGSWSDEETTVYLYLISKAIREDAVDQLKIPLHDDVKRHKLFIKGPYPRYPIKGPKSWAEKGTFPAMDMHKYWTEEQIRAHEADNRKPRGKI